MKTRCSQIVCRAVAIPAQFSAILCLLLALTSCAGFVDTAEAQSFADDGKKYNPGLYLAYGAGTNFAPIDHNPHVQGISKSYRWRDIETSEGVYDFSAIHADLTQLAARGDKKLMLHFPDTVFAIATPTPPAYITSNPIYGGGVNGLYGVYERPSGGYHELLTNEPFLARKKAFISAVAAEFDNNPQVEHILGGFMGETTRAEPPGGWSANVQERLWKEMLSFTANEFQNTRVSANINFAQFDVSRFANWAAEEGLGLTSPDLFLNYDSPTKGVPLWFEPEGIYAKQKQLSGRTPILSQASGGFSNGSWEQSWLYDGVNRRDPTGDDFIDFSQASGIFETHPDPNVQGRGTNASYLISNGYTTALRTEIINAVTAWENAGGTFAKTPAVIQSANLLNSGFESQAGSGSPVTGWGSVVGWQSDSTAANSGVELAADFGREGADGDWIAYVGPNDASVWNTSNHTISAGGTYEATLALRRGVNHETAIAEVTLYYDDNGVRMPILTEDLSADDYFFWSDRSFSFDADEFPNAIGKNLGIEIANTGSQQGFLRFDQVRLDRISEAAALLADFDANGNVDGADFLAWQRGFGAPYNASDLSNWKNEYGPPAAVSSTTAVPEPTTAVFCLLGIAFTLCSRRLGE